MSYRFATVIREDTIEYAHRLVDHPGLCKYIHGHSGKYRVSFEGGIDEQTGMVVDFHNVKKIMDENVKQVMDHALILSEDDPMADAIKTFGNSSGLPFRLVLLKTHEGKPLSPTAENLAYTIFVELNRALADQNIAARVTRVEFHETAKNSAVYEGKISEV